MSLCNCDKLVEIFFISVEAGNVLMILTILTDIRFVPVIKIDSESDLILVSIYLPELNAAFF